MTKTTLILIFTCLLSFQAKALITIQGQVTDKQGKPISKCDVFFNANAWIDDNSVHVTCDKNGNYKAQIEPGKYNSVYVCDEDKYGKTALEFWGWNLTLDKSQTLDAQFDTMEVYSLATWASNGGSNSLFASFRPMSLTAAKTPTYRNKMVDGENLLLFDITPTLTEDSIKGYVDEHPLTLVNKNWVYEKVASCGDVPSHLDSSKGCYMPMLVVQFKKPKLSEGQHTLKIDITDSNTGDFGQGITHFVANEKGLGF